MMPASLVEAAAMLAPWAVDLALGVIVIEAVLLWRLTRPGPQGPRWQLPPGLGGQLAAGAALMLALRAAVAPLPPEAAGTAAIPVPLLILLGLSVAGLAHGFALWRLAAAQAGMRQAAAQAHRPG